MISIERYNEINQNKDYGFYYPYLSEQFSSLFEYMYEKGYYLESVVDCMLKDEWFNYILTTTREKEFTCKGYLLEGIVKYSEIPIEKKPHEDPRINQSVFYLVGLIYKHAYHVWGVKVGELKDLFPLEFIITKQIILESSLSIDEAIKYSLDNYSLKTYGKTIPKTFIGYGFYD